MIFNDHYLISRLNRCDFAGVVYCASFISIYLCNGIFFRLFLTGIGQLSFLLEIFIQALYKVYYLVGVNYWVIFIEHF